jgi:pyruvate,water dikinase
VKSANGFLQDKTTRFARHCRRFLERYGFLSANGTDFSRTPWVEDPTCIWQAIGHGMSHPASHRTEEALQEIREIRAQAHARVRTQLGSVQRFVFDRLLASTLAYIDLRERSSSTISQESFQMRRVFLALGQRLVARGDLDRPNDVFYLELDELRQLASGTLRVDAQEGGAREKVAARRAEMEADAHLELPDTFCGENPPSVSPSLTQGEHVLTGISGSSGRARGYARVVSDPSRAPVTLNQDDILIVPFTDASWTPLFVRIGGLVSETGGQLSHSAIIAREYGLPAVVNVKNATRLIPDGEPIVVDGTRGRVYRQSQEEAEG